MIVCTAILLFTLLIFAPLKVRINLNVLFHKLTVKMQVKSYFVKVIDETVTLSGKYLICNGTVDTDLDVTQFDNKSGVNFAKCFTIDRVCLSLQNNVVNISAKVVLLENVLLGVATEVGRKLSHCQVYSEVKSCLGESMCVVQADVSVSIAELSFYLIKQGVKTWTRKSAK